MRMQGKRVWVAGHKGMVGSAICRRLSSEDSELVTVDRSVLDLRDSGAVKDWLSTTRPNLVFVAAAKVGGILANDEQPADFLYDNLMIEANVIHASAEIGVEKLQFLGSSCIYPKHAPQPLAEDSLLTGPLEPTNEAYAIAKIAGIKMCEAYRKQKGCNFISVMPTNLYCPDDNFDLNSSHVLPALIRKAHIAKEEGADKLTIWGTGTPRREFLHVDDLADACIFVMKHYDALQHINIGYGSDVSIIELAKIVAAAVDFKGQIDMDLSKPDGTPRKLLDTTRLQALGWSPSIALEDGVRSTYAWFRENIGIARGA